ERAAGSLELDRLGGLLRRMPWTGGAFLVGAAAIAGLPPLNGFASEWLTLQALLRVPAYGGVREGVAGALALAALAATAALAVLCFVKVVGLVLLGPPRREAVAAAEEAPAPMRAATAFLAPAWVALGPAPGLLFGPLAGLAPWAGPAPARAGLQLPGTGSLPAGGIALVLAGLAAALVLLRGRRSAAPARARARPAAGAGGGRTRGGRGPAGGRLPRARAAPDRRAALPAGRTPLARRRGARAAAAER